MTLVEKLTEYKTHNRITTKGPLAVVLFVTRKARQEGLPLDASTMKAGSAGQVAGLSKSAVQAILADYGIFRTLAAEGGRTSRGSIKNMEEYVAFLNTLHAQGEADLDTIEQWWSDQVRAFFASKPFTLKLDLGASISSTIQDLLGQAEHRQRENPGTMYAGAMLQHLVGANLQLLMGEDHPLEHHGFSVADAPTGRSGDFFCGTTSIHVTTSPGELLMEKCKDNLRSGCRPIIITISNRILAARQLAEMKEIAQQVEILDIEQVIAVNLYHWSRFDTAKQRTVLEQMITIYNQLVDAHETDPSLKIEFG